jgi:predicted ATPase
MNDRDRARRLRLVSFEVENFRIFRQERFQVHPDVSVLVGLNDVGKSTLLEGMFHYGTIAHREGSLRAALASDDVPGRGQRSTRFLAVWEVDGERWQHSLRLDPDQPEERLEQGDRFWSLNPKTRALTTHLGDFKLSEIKRYATFSQLSAQTWQLDTDVRPEVYGPTEVVRLFAVPVPLLLEPSFLAKDSSSRKSKPDRDGAGWAAWLQEIINRRNDDISLLESIMRDLFPFFRAARVQETNIRLYGDGEESMRDLWSERLTDEDPSAGDIAEPSWPWLPWAGLSRRRVLITVGQEGAEDLVVPAKRASSGLLLALAYLSAAIAAPPGSLLFLEEPENGLNARITFQMIEKFLDVVRQRGLQLVMTTHNGWWLDLVPPESVRVITRDAAGAHIHNDAAEAIRAFRAQDIYPSEVMTMHGPAGLLRPPRAAGGHGAG